MKTKATHVLVVGAIRAIHQVLFARGCRVTWFIERSVAMGDDLKREYGQVVIYQSDSSVEYLAAVARAMHGKDKFDAVCSFHDEAQHVARYIADDLQLSFPYTAEVIDNTRNKYRMRCLLQRRGLSRIACGHVTCAAELDAFVTAHPSVERFIVKPVDGTGSRGIVDLRREQLSQARAESIGALSFPAVIEEYIAGPEYSVEAFSQRGDHYIVAITEKFKDPATYMESGHLVPARLSAVQRDRITSYVAACLQALGVRHGPSHTEVIVGQSGVEIVETHTRVGGDHIPTLVKYATSVDLYELSARQALGMDFDEAALTPTNTALSACIAYEIQAGAQGPIKAITGVESVRQWPGIEKVEITYQVGDALPSVSNSFDRAAAVLSIDADPAAALARAADGLKAIRFEC